MRDENLHGRRSPRCGKPTPVVVGCAPFCIALLKHIQYVALRITCKYKYNLLLIKYHIISTEPNRQKKMHNSGSEYRTALGKEDRHHVHYIMLSKLEVENGLLACLLDCIITL
jgi:hypothetical protein